MEENLFFDRTLRQLQILFRFTGIFIKTGAQDNFSAERFKSRCIYFLHSFAANYQLFCSICWCLNELKYGEDYLGITYSAPCITISILAQFKGVFLIKHVKRAEKLIANLKNFEKKVQQELQSVEKYEIVKSEIRFLNFVTKTLNVFYATLVAGFSISPLVLIAVEYIKTKEVVLTLPFFANYGFDPFHWIIWPLIYLHQCWSELAVVLNICCADYFFFTCCTYIRIQFRLLEYDFQNIIPSNSNTNKIFIEDEDFKINFNELIKWHQGLIESANILEIIYSKSTLMNFFSSSLIICLTGFNVTTVNDVANVMTFLSFLFLSLVQVFFICFFADLLMTSSMNLSDGIYNSHLFTADTKIGKKMLMVLMRAQKPCKITAAGYADVNLKSFMRVLSSAWSYFAVLQTMYSN